MAFIKVSDLRPDDQGLNLQVKVIEAPSSVQSAASSKMAECIVGDETGIINFVARQDQVDTVQGGKDLELKSARVEMFKGSMRLSIPESGSIQQLSSPLTIKPKMDHNLSLLEFELIPLPSSAELNTASDNKAV